MSMLAIGLMFAAVTLLFMVPARMLKLLAQIIYVEHLPKTLPFEKKQWDSGTVG